MKVAVKVVEVLGIGLGVVKRASADFSHLRTLPILLLRTKFAGFVPEQISGTDAMLPPTEAGLTLMSFPVENKVEQDPFFTTALNLVVWVRFPEV
jgi:hypothetical protein